MIHKIKSDPNKPLILITNDDSIYSKGIRSLVDAVKDLGQVVVVAPSLPQSGMGHAVTLKDPIRLTPIVRFDGVLASYACSGTPVDSVKIARDIILDRNAKFTPIKTRSKKNGVFSKSSESNAKAGEMKIGEILQAVCDLNETGATTVHSLSKEQPITLDDILNLWDGIRETPGRILIISSNHYDKLDPALIRPGRIDITHELSNASHNTISDIYLHLFRTKIDRTKLLKVKEYFYSPAELINIYVSNKNEIDFMDRLMKNIKV